MDSLQLDHYLDLSKYELAIRLIDAENKERELEGVIERLKDERRAGETATPKHDPRQADLFTKLEA